MSKCSIVIGALIISGCSGINTVNAHDESKNGAARGVHQGTVHGVISDSMCKGDHTAMIKSGHGTNAITCAKKCLSEGKKLVVVEKKSNIVYTFSNAKQAKAFTGKSVAITGHIDPQTKVIHIHEIKAE